MSEFIRSECSMSLSPPYIHSPPLGALLLKERCLHNCSSGHEAKTCPAVRTHLLDIQARESLFTSWPLSLTGASHN